jgi:hypothetical protein
MELTPLDMAEISGGQQVAWTACGITFGATIGASVLFGAVGFLLTVNKTITACGIAILTTPDLSEP